MSLCLRFTNYALISVGPKSRLGVPILPKNIRSSPTASILSKSDKIFPEITASLTGKAISPFSIHSPEIPIENSPETGFAVCTPIASVTQRHLSTDLKISLRPMMLVLETASIYKFDIPTDGSPENPLLTALPVDETPSFFAV